MGDPDWTFFDTRGDDIRPACYVLESVNCLHGYFDGIGEAFTTSSVGAALSKNNWAETFYKDTEVKGLTALKEVLNALVMILGIAAVLAGLGPAILGATVSVGSALASAGSSAGLYAVAARENDTFDKAANLGTVIGSIVVDAMKSFTTANNQLMRGQHYGNADIRQYIANGAFLIFPGVFIMRGGACGDNQGIGSVPQEAVVCRENKAWYLYYWQANDVVSITLYQWGWVNPPPGADKLGQDDYKNVNVILPIVPLVPSKTPEEVPPPKVHPGRVFSQFQCMALAMLLAPITLTRSMYILQLYGHESRPVWCGPICKGNASHGARRCSDDTRLYQSGLYGQL
ncbi:hypothetical protein PENCOP_c007G00272 [Penicillium coprophilum]|uniref:Uncharacterized protein n=1 Tax=Penicillium coprophilum TaxID=36646 RepID=A0A1V6UKP3_9EURO|nr:hypothetical protein PENCOP_c007G00272 [Penicillium coprophilum]